MTISAAQIYKLNHMNRTAYDTTLGTLISNAESVVAGEIALATGSILLGAAGVGAALDVKGDGKILVGNGTTATSVAVSGDITLSNAGAVAIASGVIIDADVKSDAAIAYSKLAALATGSILLGVANVATVTDIKADKGILIGNGTTAAVQQVSGDITISNAGVTAIGSGKVTEAMMVAPVADGLHALRMAKATYDFAEHGGAQGTIGLGVTLPDNAVIVRSFLEVISALSSTGDNGTIAIQAEAANDILSAVDADTLSGFVAGISDGAVANFKKMTAAREISAVIATNDILGGKLIVYVEYYVSE